LLGGSGAPFGPKLEVIVYFDECLERFGPTSRGVDWRNSDGHRQRLEWTFGNTVIQGADRILDFGCGYGALRELLLERGMRDVHYDGFDIAASMIGCAENLHREDLNARFFGQLPPNYRCDVAVAIGTFHVKGNSSGQEFDYMVNDSLESMMRMSRRSWIASFMLPPKNNFPSEKHLRYYSAEAAVRLLPKGDRKNVKVLEHTLVNEFALYWQNCGGLGGQE
jgi:SAM-dependent methyltransferase